jgi:hypothetical protein
LESKIRLFSRNEKAAILLGHSVANGLRRCGLRGLLAVSSKELFAYDFAKTSQSELASTRCHVCGVGAFLIQFMYIRAFGRASRIESKYHIRSLARFITQT